jgi:Arc/MetJ family transcription regulator
LAKPVWNITGVRVDLIGSKGVVARMFRRNLGKRGSRLLLLRASQPALP